MNFLALWKKWIRPFAMMVYFILMMIAIPLCIVELTTKEKDTHVKAWFAGGVFVLIAVPISIWEIIQHVINYTQPHLQKYIIRIMWMVPIYALNAWFALRFKSAAIYLDTIRECYEAYVIYNFMSYLLSYLWTAHPQLHLVLQKKQQQKHLLPFCCLPRWPMGSAMIPNCKHGVLQYTVIRPITTLIALICQIYGKYDEGDFNFTSAWSYLVIVNNISQIWAMYCLILFYQSTKDLLAPIKPIPKFLCVKFVVFFSFWQAVLIAALAKFDLIKPTSFYDGKEMVTSLQDFCICIEMLFAALAHYYSFSHKPYINKEHPQGDCCVSFWSMWDISDVKDDVVEHVNAIATTMKKTVSGQFRTKADNTEGTPLLSPAANTSNSLEYTDSTKVTLADVHQNSYQSSAQPDALSSTSDWEVASMDRWNTQRPSANTITPSMHNFLDISGSLDNQSVQSHPIERSGDEDHRQYSLSGKHPGDSDVNISNTRLSSADTEEVDQTLIDFGNDENLISNKNNQNNQTEISESNNAEASLGANKESDNTTNTKADIIKDTVVEGPENDDNCDISNSDVVC